MVPLMPGSVASTNADPCNCIVCSICVICARNGDTAPVYFRKGAIAELSPKTLFMLAYCRDKSLDCCAVFFSAERCNS